MKKIFLYGLALLCASNAFAQTTTMTFSTGQTLNAAGCSVTGVTSLTLDQTNHTITSNGTPVGSCGGGPVAVVNLGISTSSYTNSSGAAAPVITWTNTTTAAAVSCTLNPANGFTATASGNTFTLSIPPTVTTATTYTFTPTCTTTTSGYTVNVVPASVSLTVNPVVIIGPGTCTTGTPSTSLGGVFLKRQCNGSVSYSGNRFGLKGYNGNLSNLSDVLYGTWAAYASGYSMTPVITSGSYVSLAFTPTIKGSLQFTNDPSYGDGGLISLSTTPGAFLPTDAGVICAFGRGASNSMYITTTAGSYCSVVIGQQYYVNFADADYSGNFLCFNGSPGACGSSSISYSEIVGK